MFSRFLLSAILFFICISFVSAQAECSVYVRFTGSSSEGNGTAEDPYQTLQLALQRNESSLDICVYSSTNNEPYSGALNIDDKLITEFRITALSSPVILANLQITPQSVRSLLVLEGVQLQGISTINNFDTVSLVSVETSNGGTNQRLTIWATTLIQMQTVTVPLNQTRIELRAPEILTSNSSIHAYFNAFAYGSRPSEISYSSITFESGSSLTLYSSLIMKSSEITPISVGVTCFGDCSLIFNNSAITAPSDTAFILANLENIYMIDSQATCPTGRPIFSSLLTLNFFPPTPTIDCQVQCVAGHYAPSGLANCVPCQPGSFKAQAAPGRCTPCPVGSYQSSSGAVGCNSCLTNTYANVTGQSWCWACPFGQASNGDKTWCASNPTTPTATPNDSDKKYLTPLWVCTFVWLAIFIVLVLLYIYLRHRANRYDPAYP